MTVNHTGDPKKTFAETATISHGRAVSVVDQSRGRGGRDDPYVSPFIWCESGGKRVHWLVCFNKCDKVLACPVWDTICEANRRVDESGQMSLDLGENDGSD